MASLLAELIGTMLLIILGDGVVANVVLKKTKGNSSGWIVITTGWALAVAIPAAIFTSVSGALFNPALTIALAIVGQFTWSQVIPYIIAQLLGAFLGIGSKKCANLGPKSLAGFIAYPVGPPKLNPIAHIKHPIIITLTP